MRHQAGGTTPTANTGVSATALLSHPVFTGAVALLAINDHILKHVWPGPITGKLSDFAGVVVVAILLVVVTKPVSMSLSLTAVGFILLKLVPSVAIWVSPLLGGVTRTDPTDLIALVVLAPLGLWLAERVPPLGRDRLHLVLGMSALAVALLATTATSAPPPTGVVDLAVGEDVMAQLRDPTGVAMSRNGGFSWEMTDREFPENPRRPQCTDAEECWRIEDGEIQHRQASGDWVVEEIYTSGEEDQLEQAGSTSCRLAAFDVLVVDDREDESTVVVSNGCRGVLVRDRDGTWEEVAVGEFNPSTLFWPTWMQSLTGAPFALFVLGLPAVVILGRRHRGHWGLGAGLVVFSAVALFVLIAVLDFFEVAHPAILGLIVTALSTVVFLVSLRVARSPRPGH